MLDTYHPSWQSCVKVPTKTCLNDQHCMGIECVRLGSSDGELLTIEEKEILEQLGRLYVSLTAVIGNSSSNDQKEMVGHIHDLQRMVMAQAACRHYPNLCRLLGAVGV